MVLFADVLRDLPSGFNTLMKYGGGAYIRAVNQQVEANAKANAKATTQLMEPDT